MILGADDLLPKPSPYTDPKPNPYGPGGVPVYPVDRKPNPFVGSPLAISVNAAVTFGVDRNAHPIFWWMFGPVPLAFNLFSFVKNKGATP